MKFTRKIDEYKDKIADEWFSRSELKAAWRKITFDHTLKADEIVELQQLIEDRVAALTNAVFEK